MNEKSKYEEENANKFVTKSEIIHNVNTNNLKGKHNTLNNNNNINKSSSFLNQNNYNNDII